MSKILTYTMRISEEERAELERKADELSITKASLIRLLIKKYLKKL